MTFNQGHTRLYTLVKRLSITLCGKYEYTSKKTKTLYKQS